MSAHLHLRMDLLNDQIAALEVEHPGHTFDMRYWSTDHARGWDQCGTVCCAVGTARLFADSWRNVPDPFTTHFCPGKEIGPLLGMSPIMFEWLYTETGWDEFEGAKHGYESLEEVPKARVIRRLRAVLRREQRRRAADRVQAINDELKRTKFRKWDWTRDQFVAARAA